jgi:hypothetical protein
MDNPGWEIKPLGWIVLILAAGIVLYLLYFFFKARRNERLRNQQAE